MVSWVVPVPGEWGSGGPLGHCVILISVRCDRVTEAAASHSELTEAPDVRRCLKADIVQVDTRAVESSSWERVRGSRSCDDNITAQHAAAVRSERSLSTRSSIAHRSSSRTADLSPAASFLRPSHSLSSYNPSFFQLTTLRYVLRY